MKYNRIFRILGMAAILSMLVMAAPATPARAAMIIQVNPETGRIGDTITVSGSGFTPSTDTAERHVDIYFAADAADTTDDIGVQANTYKYLKTPLIGYEGDPDEGEFEATFTVPAALNDGTDDEDVVSGSYYIYVTLYNTTKIKAVADFTVKGGEITIDPDEGPVGTEVEIDGSDFGNREDISVEYDGASVEIQSGDERTSSTGKFAGTTIIIPKSIAGDHTITVIGSTTGNEVEATFTVDPQMTISPTSGTSGTKVTVTGTGFGNRSNVTITLDNSSVATGQTDKYGSFDITITIPELKPGTYNITAKDKGNNSGTAKFVIATNATISATTGNIGTNVTVNGTAFAATKTVTVSYDTTQITTTTTDASGAFSAAFTVPVSKHGTHTVTVTDGTNTKQFTFAVESTPPPIPAPLKPEMGVKAKAEAYFDWQDVTDASPPVTYTLQIASDKNFTTVVLEKPGLTTSEYTLTSAEKLKAAGEEAPYYWHVKAIDAASNESAWSSAGSFYVAGFQFGLPQWAIYTLIGFGVVILFLLGFWVGRKTSYYY